MKLKFNFLLAGIFISVSTLAQQNPTGSSNTTLAPGVGNSSYSWFRGGNNQGGNAVNNNIFGTFWNSPIYTYTSSTFRHVTLGDITSATTNAAGPIQKDGFLGLNTSDPWSRLHIVGGTYGLCGGYRPWHREGINIQTNDDQLWFGHKSFGLPDQQNAVINWSDDPGISGAGPDHFVINFTATSGNLLNYPSPGVNPNAQTLDGREMMRITDGGNVGIGARFSNANAPTSHLHIHQHNDASGWLQFSNQFMTATGGNANTASTAMNANDGMRLGILGRNTLIENGNGFLYNQEERHLLFSTGNAIPSNVSNSRERMRISHIGAPTDLVTGGYGIHNPWGLPNRFTRMSVSRDPLTPVVRPMATFHIGYGYTTANNYGWRSWMDQGMLVVNNGENHMYFGFKPELDNFPVSDAVISFGKDQNQPQRLRFIYSSTSGNSANANGLEIARMWSDGNEGRTGFGDFYNLAIEPQNTVHINGIAPDDQTIGGVSGLRFHDLTSNTPTTVNPGSGVLTVDANGDVIYVAGSGTGIGNYCGNTQNPLTNDYEIPLNTFDFRFTDFNANPNQNRVSIGLPCNSLLLAKFTVNQNNTANVNQNTTSVRGVNLNNGNALPTNLTFRGVWGVATGTNNGKNIRIGGDFRGFTNGNLGYNIGVRGNAGNPFPVVISAAHLGGVFYSSSNYNNSSPSIGVIGVADGSTSTNIGVYGQAPDLLTTPGPDYAGYFNGDVLYTGQVSTSDAMFKTNIDSIDNAMNIIEQLKPRTYFYDAVAFQGKMKFQTKQQYGFIAQDVEQVLPELVGKAIQPGRSDTLGNVIFPDFEYKTLNYQGLFAILTKGIQEQQSEIDSLKQIISAQSEILSNQDSINNTLYTMITACCNNNSNMPQNNSMQQNQNGNSLDVTLTDNIPSIVLDQNVPNPFAEQTTITYTLTDGVQKAQMLFYNIEGKLIQSAELLNTAGQGQINVFANDLSTGVYTYSLVVDGQIKGTKRMVKQ